MSKDERLATYHQLRDIDDWLRDSYAQLCATDAVSEPEPARSLDADDHASPAEPTN
jgi:hypothetical protein